MLLKFFVLIVFFCIQTCEVQGQWNTFLETRNVDTSCDSRFRPVICTHYTQCGAILEGQVSYFDLPKCGFMGKGGKVCCPITTTTPTSTAISTTTSTTTPTTTSSPLIAISKTLVDKVYPEEGSSCQWRSHSGICARLVKCEPFISRKIQYKDLERCTFVGYNEIICCPLRPSIAECEKFKKAMTVAHVIGGTEASPGDFPHVGAMLYPSGDKYIVQCGASLISERFALTSAHCVVSNRPEIIRFGSVEWDPEENTTFRFDAKVKNITIHDHYVQSKVYDDIALIEFTAKVESSMLVYYACLYTENEDLPPSVSLQVAGWGSISPKKKIINRVLMSVNLTTVPLDKCKENFLEIPSFSYIRGITDGQYCTIDPSEGDKKDACKGDSGGPLMLESINCWKIIALVSFGESCGLDLPSVYTRVSYHLDWIEKIVWPHLLL